jgi:hypothetical protein
MLRFASEEHRREERPEQRDSEVVTTWRTQPVNGASHRQSDEGPSSQRADAGGGHGCAALLGRLAQIAYNMGLGISDHWQVNDAVDDGIQRREVVSLNDCHDGWSTKEGVRAHDAGQASNGQTGRARARVSRRDEHVSLYCHGKEPSGDH